MRASDEELFRRWRDDGDGAALAELFDRTAPEIWRVAAHLSRRRHEADDLVQATFLAAIESAPRFRDGERVVPWLLGILANTLRAQRRRERQKVPPDALVRGGAVDGPDDEAERAELRETLRRAVVTLPEHYRTPLLLQLEYGLTPLEIAHALHRPRATVRSHLKRGLELLRKLLPAGLLAGRSFGAATVPSLAHVRAAVLQVANTAAAPTAAGTLTGALLMAKKLSIVPAAVLVVAVAWLAWPERDAVRPPPPAGTAAPLQASAPVASTAAVAAAPTPRVLANEQIPPQRGELRVRVRWCDDAPAAGVSVHVQPKDLRGSWFSCRWLETDAAGVALCDDLAPGTLTVSTAHGGSVAATLAPGHDCDVLLRIPHGVDVHGVTVDPQGRPVPDAAILLAPNGHTAAVEVARTNGNGQFALHTVPMGGILGAIADGCFPSTRVKIGSEAGAGPVVLRLPPNAASADGVVHDHAGAPLEGAWVVAGSTVNGGSPFGQAPGEIASAPHFVRTDAAGRFHVTGVPRDRPWPLHVGAAGHGMAKVDVRVPPDRPAFVEVRLQRGVRLHGSVRAADGRAFAGAMLFVHDATGPEKGIGDARPFWMTVHRRVQEDGTFLVADLAPGRIEATLQGELDGREVTAFATFDAAPGEELQWDAVLADLAIRGRLLDDDRVPLAGWQLTASGRDGGLPHQHATTGSAGEFVLHGCADATYTLACSTAAWTVFTVPHVRPSAEEIVVQVPRARVPSCFVSGRIADDDGDGDGTPAQVWIHVADRRGGQQQLGPFARGERFEHGPLPAGRVWIAARYEGAPVLGDRKPFVDVPLANPTLAAGQRFDLGEVRVPRPGRIVLELQDPEGRPASGFVGWQRLDADASQVLVAVRDGRGEAELPPGQYVVGTCMLKDATLEVEPFAVTSGGEVVVRRRLARGWKRVLRFDLSAREMPQHLGLTWRKNGKVVQRQVPFELWQDHAVDMDYRFTAGDWRLELELPDGSRHETRFTVTPEDVPEPLLVRVPG